MYQVFEALDRLVAIVEEARGVPMTASCVVPRGDVLDLLDEIRDNIPAELDDAQDVLDHRDRIVTEAQNSADSQLEDVRSEAQHLLSSAQNESSSMVGIAQADAERISREAAARAEAIVARAEAEADRIVSEARDQHDSLIDRGRGEAERLMAAGRAHYEQAVTDGQLEQDRLVASAEITHAAHTESAKIIDDANDEADRLRNECDSYVDGRLAELEETLTKTLRTVGRGRSALRSGHNASYAD